MVQETYLVGKSAFLDENYWTAAIKRPDWYMEFVPYMESAHQQFPPGSKERSQLHRVWRHFFEEALAQGRVALASNGPDLDIERQPLDTIVIHHTGHLNYRLSYMEATQLLNIYAPYYTNPTIKEERGLKGQAIWSGHLRNGRQTFLCYHWLMRMDGSFERLLADDQIGWHAGNWDINKRSIGICLDNDYENQDPAPEILQKLAAHIKRYYPEVDAKDIIGHCEAKPGTLCPGSHFMGGWKPKFLKLL